MAGVTVAMAACTVWGHERRTNEDAIGVNGWVLWGRHPGAYPAAPSAELVLYPSAGHPATFTVADGRGGVLGAQQASLLVAEESSSGDAALGPDPAAVLEQIHRDLLRLQQATPEFGEMGSTVAGVTVRPDGRIVCFNVGDSRVYFTSSGTLVQASRDDAKLLPFSTRTRLTKWIGQPDLPSLSPWVRTLDPVPDRHLLICTDGFYNAVTDHDALYRIMADPSITRPSELIVRLGQAASRPVDDASLIVVHVLVSDHLTPAP